MVGVLVASFFILGMGLFAADATSRYGVEVTDSFNSTYERFETVQLFSDQLENGTKGAEIQSESFFLTLTGNLYKVVKLFFSLPSIVNGVLQATFASGEFAIGGFNFIAGAIIAILTLIVSIKILASILRGEI